MARTFKKRESIPLLPPKVKTMSVAAKVGEQGEGYGPAKLRRSTLVNVKIYCAMHNLDMQDFLSDLADTELVNRGYVPPVAAEPKADEPL